MKANLTIGDRFTILGMVPQEGNFATLKLLRKMRENLSLTQEEIKEYDVKQVGNDIKWANSVKTTEMEFCDYDTKLIQDELAKLEKDKKLKDDLHYNIYEQFME